MRYDWILFDADETLYSFNSFHGLKAMLAPYGIDFNQEDYAAFQAINQPLWVAYQNNEITAEDIQKRRFAKLSEQIGVEPLMLNQMLMSEMALVSKPLEGVEAMLEALYGKVKMGIITNGFTGLQQRRLENTKTEKYFDIVVVSVLRAKKTAKKSQKNCENKTLRFFRCFNGSFVCLNGL